jgi:CDP-diacylglycerol--serine O-phosphatidyltransferase
MKGYKRKRKKVFNRAGGRYVFASGFSISRMLPNITTLSALFIGLLQVKFAIAHMWENVLLAVIGAAILDATDGRLARMLNASSRFGAELDSLSDLVVFGVCPAIVLYMFSLNGISRAGWGICSFFAICMALRLARFNVQEIENVTTVLSKHGFSVGVPAPAGALVNLFPIALYNAFGSEAFQNPYLCSFISIAASMMCISKIPTFTIKKLHIKKEKYKLFLVTTIAAAGCIFVYTWKALCLIMVLYLVSIVFSHAKAKKLLASSPGATEDGKARKLPSPGATEDGKAKKLPSPGATEDGKAKKLSSEVAEDGKANNSK